MKFKINYAGEYNLKMEEIKAPDSIIIEGKTIEEVRTKAKREGEKRGWKYKDCWGEKL